MGSTASMAPTPHPTPTESLHTDGEEEEGGRAHQRRGQEPPAGLFLFSLAISTTRPSDQAAPNLQPCFPVASAEIPAAHAARRRPAGGDGLVVWDGAAAAVHGVAAQLVAAVRLAPGPPAAHRVHDPGGQLRRRRGGRQIGGLQLGDAAAWDEIIVVLILSSSLRTWQR
jgi:hypothetical protein